MNLSSFPRVPTRHLISALEDPPAAPACPDYGFPTLPTSQDRCAQPWIEVYDAPCNDESIGCLLFRRDRTRPDDEESVSVLPLVGIGAAALAIVGGAILIKRRRAAAAASPEEERP